MTAGGLGYPFRKINDDLSRVGVYFCERVSESGYGNGICFGIERSDDRAFVVFRRGRVWVLGGGSVVAYNARALSAGCIIGGLGTRCVQICERVKDRHHWFVVDGIWGGGGGNEGGDDVRNSGPATDAPANQNAGEEDGCKEKVTSVFCRCEGTTGGILVARARVEWDVLDVVMS